nr:rhamnulose-1-phosphate aldolase [uncultured Adlercreutzia sp.]
MAFFDQAQEMLSQGIDTARGAVSGVAMEQLGFVRGFVRLCSDGWEQGWHERNGGNLSYRLRPEDVDTARKFFDKEPRPWASLGVEAPTMGGAYFLVTGTGNYMRNVASDPSRNIGIVELSAVGDAYRIVWGLDDGGRPTSEFPTHVMNHAVRAAATDGTCRVIYHAHPTNIIALSYLLPLDARTFTRVLWKAMTECVVVFPAGVGVVPWMVPGGADIARATSEQMKTFDAVVWASHGLFVSGADFDSTFGLLHTIEKAADIYGRARAMNGGSGEFLNTITDEGLRQIGREFNVKINEAMLDSPAASATDN